MYEIIGHEIREVQIIQTETGTHINKPGVAMVENYRLHNQGNTVIVERFIKSTDGQQILEQPAEYKPVEIELSGDIDTVQILLSEPSFELQGGVGLKVRVKTLVPFAANDFLEVVLV